MAIPTWEDGPNIEFQLMADGSLKPTTVKLVADTSKFEDEGMKEAKVADLINALDEMKAAAKQFPEAMYETVVQEVEYTKQVVEDVAKESAKDSKVDEMLAKIDQATAPPPPPHPGEIFKHYMQRTGETEARAVAAYAEFGRQGEIPNIKEKALFKEAEQLLKDENEGRLDLQAVMKEYKLTRTGAPSEGYVSGWLTELDKVNPDGQHKDKLQELEYLTNCLLDAHHNGELADWKKAVELTNKLYKDRPKLKVPGKGNKLVPSDSLKQLEGYAQGAGKTKQPTGNAAKVATQSVYKKKAKVSVGTPQYVGMTSFGHKIMSCTYGESQYSKMKQGTENNPYMMQPFNEKVFAYGTKGAKGLCAHDQTEAMWMVKGETRWWSLCPKHAAKWTGWDYRVGEDGTIVGAEG